MIDTSTLASMYIPETDAPQFRGVVNRAEAMAIPSSCLVEFALLHSLSTGRSGWLQRLVAGLSMRIVAIDTAVAHIAADAAERFGRGTGHPARLNFGDCLSYAVAKHLDAPLLFKGDDFVHTDIRSALPA